MSQEERKPSIQGYNGAVSKSADGCNKIPQGESSNGE